MKMIQVINPNFNSALSSLMKEALPVKVSYKLVGVTKLLSAEAEKYESLRKELLQKYGLKKEDGELDTDENGNVKFDQEGINKFSTEITELHNIEIEVEPIDIDMLGSDVKVSAENLMLLDGLLK
jgi:hypothetical protein